MNDDEFIIWCGRRSLDEPSRRILTNIRKGRPARRVRAGAGNVIGFYPSRKMGRTIQFESHRNELAFIHEAEHDPGILEFYDQPLTICLRYESKGGHPVGVDHTPDFLVLSEPPEGWWGLVECKEEEKLVLLTREMPNRYSRDPESGRWRCPPGEEAARRHGMGYRVYSSAEIDRVRQRNFVFLEDYMEEGNGAVTPAKAEAISRALASLGLSANLQELAEKVEKDGTASRDDLHFLIATGALHVDLSAAPLAEPERVTVCRDRITAGSLRILTRIRPPRPDHLASARPIQTRPGSALVLDGRTLTVVNAGHTRLLLSAGEGGMVEMPVEDFEILVQRGEITAAPSAVEESRAEAALRAQNLFKQANPKALARANQAFDLIEPYLETGIPRTAVVPAGAPSMRTVRRWLAAYRRGEAIHGLGFAELVGIFAGQPATPLEETGSALSEGARPGWRGRGNHQPRLPEQVRRLMESTIAEKYETVVNRRANSVYGELRRVCEENGLVPPSGRTFYRAIRLRRNAEQTRKRQGPRAAYKQERFHWHLDDETPVHGDRPWEVVHIDHTLIDIELVCARTEKNLGRPWLTLMIDAYSRRILALHLTFDEPSYRSCMMVMRRCVQRHSRLPQTLVIDGGPEFRSTYFETFLAAYRVTKKQRPPAKARFGSVIERLFGTAQSQVFHNLVGNTQLTRNVRQVTKSVNPKNHAAWTLDRLHVRLCEYAFEVYDANEHRSLGMSPREAFIRGIDQTGTRRHRMVAYDETFLMLTLPTTARGVAKVVPGNGVKIKYFYYWAEQMRDPRVEGEEVPIRFDPFDLSVAYAFVGKRWVRCLCQHWRFLQNRSERELAMATEELRQRDRLHTQQQQITAKRLAIFLASAEAEETLHAQRMHDAASRDVSDLAEGRTTSGPAKAEAADGPGPAAQAPSAQPGQIDPRPTTWGDPVAAEDLEVF